MKKTISVIVMTIGFLVLSGLWSFMVFADTPGEKEVLYPIRIDVKPKIDGVLDEEIWKTQPLERDFYSYFPNIGETIPYKTLVWMSYDSKNLYFAFLCLDPEPGKIKTSNTRRDNIRFDNWVGLVIDTLGKKQTAWALIVNPIGTQHDILESAVTRSDLSADLEWESAGQVTDKGYQVEICIPLRNISFKGGKEVKMGIFFWRNITRLNIRGCWPQYTPRRGVFGTLTQVVYKDLKRPLKLELTPHIIYGSEQPRVNPDKWGNKDVFKRVGLDVKYGLTSTITADITVNPDFSQVESDEWHLEVNRRYPIFYPEQRPYFTEGMGAFDFFTPSLELNPGIAWISPENFIPYAIYTRQIMDPAWSAKLTGNIGKTAFGFLGAGDEWPGQPWEWGENPNEGKQAFWGIARGKYSLGKKNYIGLLYSGHEFAGQHNRTFGADFKFGLFKSHEIRASFIHSNSSDGNSNDRDLKGSNINLQYFIRTKTLKFRAVFDHIGTDFIMDSAFLRRTGINHSLAAAEYNYNPNLKKLKWLKRISPGIRVQYLHDLNSGMDDSSLALYIDIRLSPTGNFGIIYLGSKESWQEQIFNLTQLHLYGWMQLTPWLRFAGFLTLGDKIYYDGEPSFKGKANVPGFYVDLQPSKKLGQRFEYYYFNLSKDSQKIYGVDILFSRTTYHLNKNLFLKAILRYNSYQKKLLTEFLASFTMIPGTILQMGYQGMYENRGWMDDNWSYRQGDLLNIHRSFFLKLSYHWRF